MKEIISINIKGVENVKINKNYRKKKNRTGSRQQGKSDNRLEKSQLRKEMLWDHECFFT